MATKQRKQTAYDAPDHLMETSDLDHPTAKKFNRKWYRDQLNEKQKALLDDIDHHKVVDPADLIVDEDADA